MQRGSFMMTSHDSEPVAVAWQMRVRGALGSWFSWDSIDQDEYNLYQRSPTSGVEVRALYAAPPAPSSPPGMREALEKIAKEVFTDGTPTKAARTAKAALSIQGEEK